MQTIFNSYKNIYAICVGSVVLFILLKMDMLIHFTANESKAFDAGLVAAFATALGTLPVLFSKKISQRAYDISLGFGSGVMLSACIFSLILPSLEAAKILVSMPMLATTLVGFCIIFGAAFLLSIDIACPHHVFIQHFDEPDAQAQRRIWLFVFAIFLHNLPEGLAIGAAFSGVDLNKAQSLSWGIAIQDVPEGLVIAIALRGMGKSALFSACFGAISGLVEPFAALAAVLLIGQSSFLLPMGMAFTAGAMLYVISHEIIPESHRAGHALLASASLMFGFVLMMILDAGF